jgi:23S rRNA A2030 N6-methylase RlmJ
VACHAVKTRHRRGWLLDAGSRASSLTSFLVGALKPAMETLTNKAKAYWYPCTNRRKSRMETPPYNAVVVRQAIKDDLANSGLRVRLVIGMKLAE